LVQILGGLFGFLLGSYLSDAIGRKWTFVLSAIGSLAMILIYMFVPMDNTALLFVGIPLFIIFLMKFPPMGPFMTELYPTAVRGTAQGFCYNAGRAIGSFSQPWSGLSARPCRSAPRSPSSALSPPASWW
jgi:sugar phosphate permease